MEKRKRNEEMDRSYTENRKRPGKDFRGNESNYKKQKKMKEMDTGGFHNQHLKQIMGERRRRRLSKNDTAHVVRAAGIR